MAKSAAMIASAPPRLCPVKNTADLTAAGFWIAASIVGHTEFHRALEAAVQIVGGNSPRPNP